MNVHPVSTHLFSLFSANWFNFHAIYILELILVFLNFYTVAQIEAQIEAGQKTSIGQVLKDQRNTLIVG